MARDPASIDMRAASQRLRQLARGCEVPVACLGSAPRIQAVDRTFQRQFVGRVGVPSFGLPVAHEGWAVIEASGCADGGPTPTASRPTQADGPTDAIPDGPPRIVHDQPCDERTSHPSPSGIVPPLPMIAQDDVTALSRPLGST